MKRIQRASYVLVVRRRWSPATIDNAEPARAALDRAILAAGEG